MSGAAAAHFAGKNVTFEIWNEPNLAGFWPPAPDAARYAALSAAAIAAIHTADPNAKVSTAGISGFDFAFLRGYLAANGASGADAIGVHPYRQVAPETLTDELLWMRTIVGGTLSPAPPVWDTEWGYSSTWYGDGHDPATRKIQAVRTVRKMLSAWAVGFPLSVYYDLRDDGTDGANGEHNFGLIQNDDSDKPAIQAVRALSAAARNRTFAGFIPLEPSNVHAMRLDGTSDTIVVVWSDAPGGSVDVTISGAPQVDDMFGAPQTVAPGVLAVREVNGPLYVTYRNQRRSDAGAGGAGPLPDGGTASGGAPTATGGASNAGTSNGGGRSNGGASSNGGTSSGGSSTANGGTAAEGGLVTEVQSAEDSGCGCRMASPPQTWGWPGAMIIAALVRRVRRRRRSRGDSEIAA
jgi:MYXO-CTERM domain-containing protein